MPQPQVGGGGWASSRLCRGLPALRALERRTVRPLLWPHEALPRCRLCSNGGSIGWIGRGQTVPEFEEAAFGCAPGGLAQCETRFGLHLLTVTAER